MKNRPIGRFFVCYCECNVVIYYPGSFTPRHPFVNEGEFIIEPVFKSPLLCEGVSRSDGVVVLVCRTSFAMTIISTGHKKTPRGAFSSCVVYGHSSSCLRTFWTSLFIDTVVFLCRPSVYV